MYSASTSLEETTVNDHYQELMDDLRRSLSEALDRAQRGNATSEDWLLIRTQLGF